MNKIICFVFFSLIFYANICFTQEANLESFNGLDSTEWSKVYEKVFSDFKNHGTSLKGTGYNPYFRLKRFYDLRYNKTGNTSQQDRVKIYKDLIKKQANSKSGTPISDWENIGPHSMETYGGRVISHAFDPDEIDKIWVGSASGGLWLTENGGASWKAKTDDIPSTGIGAIALHPTLDETLLIGTGEGVINNTITIKAGSGIYKSTDDGLSWEQTNFNPDLNAGISIMDLKYNPEDPEMVWAASTDGLFKSEDGGMNWQRTIGDGTNHGGFIFNKIIISKQNPDIIFVAREGFGIYKSVNGGDTFEQLIDGLPLSDINIIDISQCSSKPNVLYTSIINATNFGLKGVYKTVDGGDSWSRLDSAPAAPCSPQFISACQGWYNNFIEVSPYNPDHVYFGGVTMWQSKDGGTTWTQKDRLICPNCADPPPCTMYADHHDFGFSPVDSNILISLNDGGVAISRDNGECFEDANNEMITAQFIAISSSRRSPNIVIGGFQDHGLQEANLGQSRNWNRWGWLDGADVEVNPENEFIYYGTWHDGSYWKFAKFTQVYASPINNGINLQENTGGYFAPLAVNPEDGNMLLGSTQQKLYKSTTGGALWTPVLTASVISDITFSEADVNFAYATAWTGSSWTFYRSEDSGSSWQATAMAPGWRVTDIKTSAQDPLLVYASRNSINAGVAHVYKSTDGGESWISIQGDLPDITTNALAVDLFDDDILFAGTDLGVFISENGGTNWKLFSEGMPITYVYDLDYNPTDSTLIAGTLGRGAWRTKVYNEIVNSVHNLQVEKLAFKISPNPSTSYINFEVIGELEGSLKINILNALGQNVHSLFQGDYQNQGSFKFDLPKLSNTQVYFIQAVTQNRIYMLPLIIKV